jgi:hypothetical protein
VAQDDSVKLLTSAIGHAVIDMVYGNGALYTSERNCIRRVDCGDGSITTVLKTKLALINITGMCWAVGSETVLMLCNHADDTIYRVDLKEVPVKLRSVFISRRLRPVSICQHVGVGEATYVVGTVNGHPGPLCHLTVSATGKATIRSIADKHMFAYTTVKSVVARGGLVLCSVYIDSEHDNRLAVWGTLYNYRTSSCDTIILNELDGEKGYTLPCEYIRSVDGTDSVLFIDSENDKIHTGKLPSVAWCTGAPYLLPWLSLPINEHCATASLKSFTDGLWKQAKSGTHCDVELRCGAWSMKAHKVVLSASSSYFRAMFESGCVEGLPSAPGAVTVVNVGDVAHTWSVNTLLRWIYTRDINVRTAVVEDTSDDEDSEATEEELDDKEEASSSR